MGSQEYTFALSLKNPVLAGCRSAVRADGLGIVPDWGQGKEGFLNKRCLRMKTVKSWSFFF